MLEFGLFIFAGLLVNAAAIIERRTYQITGSSIFDQQNVKWFRFAAVVAMSVDILYFGEIETFFSFFVIYCVISFLIAVIRRFKLNRRFDYW
ncbi:hypothetical protein [Neoaquamicrobium sediminum]|uniref:Uncharacterized protein n=1 Tax=Neoaquamicrobium sediminum TaxID=1849104 RepID=A0ABV3WUQ2_9HYPH